MTQTGHICFLICKYISINSVYWHYIYIRWKNNFIPNIPKYLLINPNLSYTTVNGSHNMPCFSIFCRWIVEINLRQ